MNVEPIVEMGYERDSLTGRQAFRWWLFLRVPGRRYHQARQGVVDRGFHFARGGRAETEDDCRWALIEARRAAEREMGMWNHQPSHALGPHGELIPLDEVAGEKRRIDA